MVEKRTVSPRMNIYTVLSLIGFLLLAGGTGYMWAKNVEMTQPDQLKDDPTASGTNPWFVLPMTENQKSVAAEAVRAAQEAPAQE